MGLFFACRDDLQVQSSGGAGSCRAGDFGCSLQGNQIGLFFKYVYIYFKSICSVRIKDDFFFFDNTPPPRTAPYPLWSPPSAGRTVSCCSIPSPSASASWRSLSSRGSSTRPNRAWVSGAGGWGGWFQMQRKKSPSSYSLLSFFIPLSRHEKVIVLLSSEKGYNYLGGLKFNLMYEAKDASLCDIFSYLLVPKCRRHAGSTPIPPKKPRLCVLFSRQKGILIS